MTDYYQKGLTDAHNVLQDNVKAFIIKETNGTMAIMKYNKDEQILDADIQNLTAECNISLNNLKALNDKQKTNAVGELKDIDKLLYMMGITKVTKYVALLALNLSTQEARSKKANTKNLASQNDELQLKLKQAVEIITELTSYEDFITEQVAPVAPAPASAQPKGNNA
jgi:hypothetical protein